MFCRHKWGEIRDGYQYCKKCGKAILVPCNHQWTIIQNNELYDYRSSTMPVYLEKVLQCSKCGSIKKLSVE